jgi:site-specific DNA recombinase
VVRKNTNSTKPAGVNKSTQIINLLKRPNGASVPELMKAATWQAHSVSKQSSYAQLMGLKSILGKMTISPSEMAITMKVANLLDLIRGKTSKSILITTDHESINLHSITTYIRLGRRGRETRLILYNSGTEQRPVDQSLLSSIARGYAWRHEIISGKSKSSIEIARRKKVTPSFVSRLIDVSFLAPDILAAIADGTAPVGLTANKLQNTSNIPLDWQSQRYVLGFCS